MKLKNKIQNYMQAHGLSQYRVTRDAQLAPNTLRDMFRGKTSPSIDTLERICTQAFGISVFEFLSLYEGDVILNEKQKILAAKWLVMTSVQRRYFLDFLQNFEEDMNNGCFDAHAFPPEGKKLDQ